MQSDKDIAREKKALIDKLSRMIADDAREARTLNTRLKENKALLASLKKHGHKSLPQEVPEPTKRKPRTRLSYGPRYEVITAIHSIGRSIFTGSEVYAEVKKLFPETTMTRAHLSSLLWKMSSSDKDKDRVDAIRKIKTSKGGTTESEYEKVVNSTNGKEPH